MNAEMHGRHLRDGAAMATAPSMRLLRALALKRRLEDGYADDGVPLCVGLDGALVHGRVTHEAGIALLRKRPLALLRLLPLAWRRPALFKARLSELSGLDPALLPFRRETLRFLREHHARGRALVLVGTVNQRMVRAVADHLGIFCQGLGSDSRRDLTATEQARLLCAAFGPGEFDYVGAERRDIPIWGTARRAVILSAERRILRHPQWNSQAAKVVTTGAQSRHAWLDAMRPSHWPRNLLIFAPLLAQNVFTIDRLVVTYCGACACGLIAAASEMIAGMLGPTSIHGCLFPRGEVSARRRLEPGHTLVLAGFFAALGMMVALSISAAFAAWMAVYPLLAIVHAIWLKRIAGAATVMLASFDLHRLLAGGIAIGIKAFPWQLGLAVPFFLALAAWRCHTAMLRCIPPGCEFVRRRWLRLLGIAAGCVSAFVLMLYAYLGDPARSLGAPMMAGVLCALLLYWLSVAWLSHAPDWGRTRRNFAFRPAMRRIACTVTVLVAMAAFIVPG